MKKYLAILSVFFFLGITVYAQKPLHALQSRACISTNILEWANMLTINAEASFAVAKNYTIGIQGKYNPFTFNKHKAYSDRIQHRQTSVAISSRWWPWHAYSGWFVSSGLQAGQYNYGGLFDVQTYEGDYYGLNISAGYALMLNRHLNLDFGIGAILGHTDYTKYSCPKCGKIEEQGKKIFVAPNNILIQLSYLF